MIKSAEEFVRLRNSEIMEEYHKAAHDEAPIEVWLEVINNYPDMAEWVAHNKKIQYKILEILATHKDSKVRHMVAKKNKLKEPLLLLLASDEDESVRHRVALHKKATKKVLLKLVDDSWEKISESVQKRLAIGEYK